MSAAVVLALATAAQPAGPPPGQEPQSSPFGFDGLGKSKEPINVTSDNLEYDYKANVVVYRGAVEVIQGAVKLTSDTLTVTMVNDKKDGDKKAAADKTNADKTSDKAGDSPAADPGGGAAAPSSDTGRVQNIVAAGNVRIDQGTRWAVGGQAVFDQGQRTLVLTENPVLHDGPNVVAGDRVVVFLDENRSIVEGGRKRVKAVLYPNSNDTSGGQAGTPAKPKAKSAPAATARKAR